jgi:hypothetical protein
MTDWICCYLFLSGLINNISVRNFEKSLRNVTEPGPLCLLCSLPINEMTSFVRVYSLGGQTCEEERASLRSVSPRIEYRGIYGLKYG